MHIGARTNAFFCLVPAVKIFLPLIEGLFSAPDAEDPVTRSLLGDPACWDYDFRANHVQQLRIFLNGDDVLNLIA